MVAILDTGVADHRGSRSAAADPVVERLAYERSDGSVRADDRGRRRERRRTSSTRSQGLIDPFFGHGTFIAGLIHQACPDADILSIKMMGNDGIVDEAALLNGLGYLHQRQVDALGAGRRASRA